MPIFASKVSHFDFKASGILHSLKAGLVGAFVAAAFSLLLQNYYRSEAKVLPLESKGASNLGSLAAAAAAFGMGVPGQDMGDANFLDILTSRSLKEALLTAEYEFHVRSWRFGNEEVRTQTLFDYLKAKNMDQAVRTMNGVLVASKDIKTRILYISSETKSPELSQLIVRKAVENLERFVQGKGRTRGNEKARFAEARLKEARAEMDQTEEMLRRFLQGNRNFQVSGDPTIRLLGARLEAELKLRQQLVLTLSMNREQALLEEKNDIPIVNILDPANLPIDKSRPTRAVIVILGFLLSTIGAWLWRNRVWIKAVLSNDTSLPFTGDIYTIKETT